MSNYINFDKLSLPFIMDLYRAKMKAEARGDASAIMSLKINYPELFSENFSEFIQNFKHAVKIFDYENGENFSKIFEIESNKEKTNSH